MRLNHRLEQPVMVNSAVRVVDGQIGHVTPPVDKQGI